MPKHVAKTLEATTPDSANTFPRNSLFFRSSPGTCIELVRYDLQATNRGRAVAVSNKMSKPEIRLHVRDYSMFHGTGIAADRLRKPSTSFNSVAADLWPEKEVKV